MRKLLFILLIGICSCTDHAGNQKTQAVNDTNTIAAVKLTDLEGQPVNLEQFKGKTVFLNFWATWCKPCIREMPSIESAEKQLSKKGVVFLLASDESPDLIREFKKQHPSDLNFVRLMNMEELNMVGLPTTYIYNSKGEKAFAEIGYRKWDDSSNIEIVLKISNQK